MTKVEQIVKFLRRPFSDKKTFPPVLQTLFRFVFFTDNPYSFSEKRLGTYTLQHNFYSTEFSRVLSTNLRDEDIWNNQNERVSKPFVGVYRRGVEPYPEEIDFTSHDRIGRVISFLNHQPVKTKLATPKKNSPVDLIAILFFIGPTLYRQLKKEPRTAIQLMQMIHLGLKQYQRQGNSWDDVNLKEHLNYLHLALRLKEQIDFASKESPDTYAPFKEELAGMTVDFAHYLKTEVYSACTPEQKILVMQILSQFHEENIAAHLKEDFKNTAKDLLLSPFYSIMGHYSKSILQKLAHDPATLNEVMSYILKMKTGIEWGHGEWSWKQDQRYCCNGYEIQFDTGKILFLGNPIDTQIPFHILRDLALFNIISKNNYQTRQISPKVFEIKTQANIFKLTIDEKNYCLETEIDGLNYQLEQSSNDDDSPFDGIPWIDVDKDLIWLCADGNTSPHYLVKKHQGNQLYMHIEEEGDLQEGLPNRSKRKIAFISDDLAGSRMLVTPSKSPFGTFIEESKGHFWKNRDSNQMIDSIELPIHLHFKVENGQIHCPSLPGFHLVDPLEWSQN